MVVPDLRVVGSRRSRRVVIVGGGVAALEVLLALDALAGPRVRIELIAPGPDFVYQPMSVLEPFALGKVPRLDLERVVSGNGGSFRRDSVSRVDTDRRLVFTSTGARIAYDALVIAAGVRRRSALPGALEFGNAESRSAFGRLLEAAAAGVADQLAFVLPKGVSWPLPIYELTLLATGHLDARVAGGARVTLVTPEPEPLTVFGPAASRAVSDLLESEGIAVETGISATGVPYGRLELSDGRSLPADRVITLPYLNGPGLMGLPFGPDGFIPADSHCRVRGVEDVFVAGDASDYPIKQGGLATQQADAVAELIAADAGARCTPHPFDPVLRAVLVSGKKELHLRTPLADVSRAVVADHPIWWPPAKIAGRYISPFLSAQLGPVAEEAGDAAIGRSY